MGASQTSPWQSNHTGWGFWGFHYLNLPGRGIDLRWFEVVHRQKHSFAGRKTMCWKHFTQSWTARGRCASGSLWWRRAVFGDAMGLSATIVERLHLASLQTCGRSGACQAPVPGRAQARTTAFLCGPHCEVLTTYFLQIGFSAFWV